MNGCTRADRTGRARRLSLRYQNIPSNNRHVVIAPVKSTMPTTAPILRWDRLAGGVEVGPGVAVAKTESESTVAAGRKVKAPLFEAAIGKGLEAGFEAEVKVKVEIEVKVEVASVTVGPTGWSVVITEELVGGEMVFEPPADVVPGVLFCELEDDDCALDDENWGGDWVVEEVNIELVASGVDVIVFMEEAMQCQVLTGVLKS